MDPSVNDALANMDINEEDIMDTLPIGPNSSGRTALWSIHTPEDITKLIKRGCEVNHADGYGETALAYFCNSMSWHPYADYPAIVERLLHHGADQFLPDADGAIAIEQFYPYLSGNGQDPQYLSEVVELLLSQWTEEHFDKYATRTLREWLSESGEDDTQYAFECLNVFVEKFGASRVASVRDERGRTLLHFASGMIHSPHFKDYKKGYEFDQSPVKPLLDIGVDPNTRDVDNMTALDYVLKTLPPGSVTLPLAKEFRYIQELADAMGIDLVKTCGLVK